MRLSPFQPSPFQPFSAQASDGGCDTGQHPAKPYPWTREIAAIPIAEGDAITDKGTEVYSLLRTRGIRDLLVMGVHAPITQIPILTVCEALRDPGRYAGQAVIVVGRSVGSDEGGWLDEDCGLKPIIQGRTYRAVISTTYVATEFAPPPRKPRGFSGTKARCSEHLIR